MINFYQFLKNPPLQTWDLPSIECRTQSPIGVSKFQYLLKEFIFHFIVKYFIDHIINYSIKEELEFKVFFRQI